METLVISPYEEERKKPMPSKNHAFIQTRLVVKLSISHSDKYDTLSEVSLDLNGDYKVPDIAICKKSVIDFQHDEIRLSEIPLGIVEILSPSQSLQEVNNKIEEYLLAGVKSCWLVLPSLLSIYVFSSPTDYKVFTKNETLEDKQLGITLSLKEIFS